MGNCCACCCTPRWRNEQDVVCAYLYEECACFRKRKFILRGVGKNDEQHEWNLPSNATARQLIEAEVFNPQGLPIQIAQETPRACCGYEMFDATVNRLNEEWVPKMNASLEVYGFEVDGFEWVEMRYVSHGQYGGSMHPVPHCCIRIKKLPVLGDTVKMDDNEDDEKVSKDK